MASQHFNYTTLAVEWSYYLAVVIDSLSANDMAQNDLLFRQSEGLVLVVRLDDHSIQNLYDVVVSSNGSHVIAVVVHSQDAYGFVVRCLLLYNGFKWELALLLLASLALLFVLLFVLLLILVLMVFFLV